MPGAPVDAAERNEHPVMVLLDTSILIDTLTGARTSGPVLRAVLSRGERVTVPSLVIYEWLRGPRTEAQIANQERLFPSRAAIPFGPEEAGIGARLYRSVARAQSREMDIAIAACAIRNEAALWTLNSADFADIPGLRLFKPSARS